METTTVTETIKAKRIANKVTIADLAKAVNKSPTFVAAALNGNHRLTTEEAETVGKMLDLDKDSAMSLCQFSYSNGLSKYDRSF